MWLEGGAAHNAAESMQKCLAITSELDTLELTWMHDQISRQRQSCVMESVMFLRSLGIVGDRPEEVRGDTVDRSPAAEGKRRKLGKHASQQLPRSHSVTQLGRKSQRYIVHSDRIDEWDTIWRIASTIRPIKVPACSHDCKCCVQLHCAAHCPEVPALGDFAASAHLGRIDSG